MNPVLQAYFNQMVEEGRWLAITSSNLKMAGYLPGVGMLWVQFHTSGVYAYTGVSPSVYAGLASASSAGKYFHQHIKNQYPTYGPFAV